ncbi:MAG: hypothetical protein ABR502_11265, partial [Chitinophagaceae bacterium]
MKKLLSVLPCIIALQVSAQTLPPVARKVSVVFEEFGYKRTDDYYWMKDKNDPAVLEYIKQENAYAEAMLRPLQPLQQKLYEEMKNRQAKTFSSLPVKRNGWW